MKIQLSSAVFGEFEVDDHNLIGVYGPTTLEGPGISDVQIRERFAHPIGIPSLAELARGKNKVVIVTDDNTRATPLPRLLPPLLDILKEAGVRDEQILFLVGLGTHRDMTELEIIQKFGKDIASKYRVINHEWGNPEALVNLGKSELGFEVVISRHAVEADMLLVVGSIVPHATTGFSGGGKAIMPGICGEKTIEDTHWKALDFAMAEILGNFDNPVRQAVVDVCRRVGLSAIVNTILFDGDKIHDLVVGDVEAAHRQGVKSCLEVYGVPVNGQADIVVAEAYPTDIDLRQAIKAICSADIVCRDNGVIILPANCPEGAAPQFPDFEYYGFSNPDDLYQEVEEGVFSQKLLAYTLVAIGRIISKRVKAILVSENIDATKAEQMGFQHAATVDEALARAYEMVGQNRKVMVLKQAGQILPVI